MEANTMAKVENEARELINRIKVYRKAHKDSAYISQLYGRDYTMHKGCPKESAAIRRASMDLTRALAELRRS